MHYNFDSVQDWIDAGMPVNSYILGDCMKGMAAMPDGFAQLAIVDPQYGLKISSKQNPGGQTPSAKWKNVTKKNYIIKSWDNEPPPAEYFKELYRISENQIIFGANHFISKMAMALGIEKIDLLDASYWIVWDKLNGETNFADCELAWTSFDGATRKIEWLWNGFQKKEPEYRIHPTQKPKGLYCQLLRDYAHLNDLIVDTHVGSASSLIACEQMGFSYIGFEKDEDYYRDSVARMVKARELFKQNDLFSSQKLNGHLAETMKLFEE